MDFSERSEMLLGRDAIEKLSSKKVIVFGAGGVGGYVIEALVRSGVGAIDVVDNDTFSVSNLNRQILAVRESIGRPKAVVAVERIKSVNPNCSSNAYEMFFLPENADLIDLSSYDLIIDAIDTVSAKIELACRADRLGIPMIASMGTGNKLDPSRFEIADIYSTSVCPLARVMRRELKKRNVKGLLTLYSKEEPIKTGSSVPGSVAYVPSVAGLLIAKKAVELLINN